MVATKPKRAHKSYINDQTAEDVEQTVRFSIKTGLTGFGLMARRSDSDSDTYYYTYVETGETLKIMKMVDGTAYELLDTEIDIGSGRGPSMAVRSGSMTKVTS